MMKQHRIQRLHSSSDSSVMAVLESTAKHHRTKQNQRRSRKASLWVLLSFLMTLVLVANLFASGQGASSVDWNRLDTARTSVHRHERRLSSLYRSGEILIGDYDEIQEYYQNEAHYEQEQQQAEEQKQEWSQEQLEEMERYYKRYLQVFKETHGDQYKPESKEVVYAEYQKYLAKKQKAEQEQATAQATRGTTKSETPPPPEEPTTQVEEESPNESPSLATKYDPFFLETDWEYFNEVGGDRLNQSNNSYTRTTKAAIF